MAPSSNDEIVRRQRERTRRDIAAASKIAADKIMKEFKAEKKSVSPETIAEIIRATMVNKLGA
jgi:hypothetical protein